jgi:hypothetical protein
MFPIYCIGCFLLFFQCERQKCGNKTFWSFFQFEVIWRAVFLLLMVLCNVFMFRSFNKALQSCQTTIEASIINTAANFVATVLPTSFLLF